MRSFRMRRFPALEVSGMADKVRKLGVGIIGDVPWGTHFCQFYQTREDLLDIVVPYFRAGLQNNEFCLWITAEPLNEKKAQDALKKAMPDFDGYFKKGQIEILPYDKWYLKEGVLNIERALHGLIDKLNQALAKGYDGLRLNDTTSWVGKKDWQSFANYEAELNNIISKYSIVAICSYCLDKCAASDLIDVVINHQFSCVRREGNWKIIESRQHKLTDEALRESEERFRSLVETTSDWIWEADANGTYTYASPKIRDILGYEPREIVGKKPFDFMPPEEARRVANEFAAFAGAGRPFSGLENINLHKNGRRVVLETSGVPVFNSKGNLLGYRGIDRDVTERKRVEEALRRSEEKLRIMFESMADGITVVDLTGNILEVNEAIVRQSGYNKEELLGGHRFILQAPSENYRVEGNLNKIITEENRGPTEYTFIRKDGAEYYVEVNASLIRDIHGNPDAIICIIRDITERKRADEALRRSEEELRVIFESVVDGIIVTDMEGNILELNETAALKYGYKKEELIGQYGFQMLAPKDLAKAAENVQRMLSEGRDATSGQSSEYTILRKDGTEFLGEVRTSYARDVSGKPVAAISVVRDITERRLAEQALQKSEAEYRLLVENANEGIIVVCDGIVRFANPKTVEMSGYSREELMSRLFIDFVHPDDRGVMRDRHVRRLKGEQFPGIYPFRIVDKNGNTRWLEINAVLISWENKPATLNFLNDITLRKQMEEQVREYSEDLERMVAKRTQELKEAQEKLVRSEKLAAMGQLAGSVGHELRNPLAAIRTSAYFIKAKLENVADEKVHKHLDMLDKQVVVCDRIITDILDFSRPGKTNIGEIDINKVICEQVKNISAPKNIEISTSLAENLAKVMADSGQLERVLSNLISNAIQAMPGGGKLSFSTNRSGEFIEVKVTDTGEGISQENLNKIFEPLFTTRAKGVGLGLALAKALVERQGGTIRVESQIGKGTTFTVKLPIVGV